MAARSNSTVESDLAATDLIVILSKGSAPLPKNARSVECRRKLAPSTEGTNIPDSDRRGGTRKSNMKPLRLHRLPSHGCLQPMGKI